MCVALTRRILIRESAYVCIPHMYVKCDAQTHERTYTHTHIQREVSPTARCFTHAFTAKPPGDQKPYAAG